MDVGIGIGHRVHLPYDLVSTAYSGSLSGLTPFAPTRSFSRSCTASLFGIWYSAAPWRCCLEPGRTSLRLVGLHHPSV